ncbi:hypothetical protein E2C01_016203 [Portunus trituberculatus]|uniref:Uncharacterized protein n=1 Tax=Portunus trituberculatus TaxID=210409 RepID=A0A5B7DQ47_PORTR|nr:hypothetical protein [Portunus trituberculatus]
MQGMHLFLLHQLINARLSCVRQYFFL